MYESAREIKDALLQFKIEPKKRLGQHFLIDPVYLDRISSLCGSSTEGVLIEIGAGIGNLTCRLAEVSSRVLAVEFDRGLTAALTKVAERYPNVEVVAGDATKINLYELAAGSSGIKICGNLPYNIAGTLILDYLEKYRAVKEMTFLIQKEAAERILASPGTKAYGAYTLKVGYYAEASRQLEVPREAFYPKPEVLSWLIKLERKAVETQAGKELFFKVVNTAFAQRRKKIINNFHGSDLIAGLDRGTWEELLRKCGIEPGARSETVSFTSYVKLVKAVKEQKKSI